MTELLESKTVRLSIAFIICIISFAVIWNIVIAPSYNIYMKELRGKADLAEATYNRQIAVQEAEAKKEASKSLADAEVIRAQGVAKANEIIGQSLNNNEAYLRYLWIDSLHDQQHQIIYVPTESNLPLLEAGRIGNSTR